MRLFDWLLTVAAILTVAFVMFIASYSIAVINDMESNYENVEEKLIMSEEANRSLQHQNEMLNDILKNR